MSAREQNTVIDGRSDVVPHIAFRSPSSFVQYLQYLWTVSLIAHRCPVLVPHRPPPPQCPWSASPSSVRCTPSACSSRSTSHGGGVDVDDNCLRHGGVDGRVGLHTSHVTPPYLRQRPAWGCVHGNSHLLQARRTLRCHPGPFAGRRLLDRLATCSAAEAMAPTAMMQAPHLQWHMQ